MKRSKKWIVSIICILLIFPFVLHIGFVANLWMLFTERANFIPKQSSIFTFKPYIINEGSSNYWLYGEDNDHYYYFTYEKNLPYIYISKINQCIDFDKSNYKTWCKPFNGEH